MNDRFGEQGAETPVQNFSYLLKWNRGLQKSAVYFIGGKFEFERLASQPDRLGKQIRINGLMTDIDNAMLDFIRGTGKKHAFQAPERKKYQFLIAGCIVRQQITKITAGVKIGVHPAVFAAEKPVCFFENRRGAALGALMFDEKIDNPLQLR